ncbi:UNVERIFIED_CONTAM: Pollen receptor-like kinase [Sesamum calycinum]|uniref:Pollen receptor-like kinase n=1 Tax=Sesamum calycinum TaxID=2727403 RepID=A0AAW2N2E4_9LAMI
MAAVRLFLLSLFVFCLRTNPSHAIGEDVHLIDFKESLKDSSPLDSSWIKGSNPCDAKKPWQGIDCSDTGSQAVSAILLMNRGLSGAGPDLDIDALSKLGSLRFLSLENNSFSGPLPEFNQLSSLRSLFLSGNQFSGEIPQGYFDKMGSLKKLHLARNKFTGPIPGSLTKLSNLMEMWLQENEFSGPVPSFEQKSLQSIDLSNNKLQGEIPQSMSRFPASVFQGNADVCGSVVSKQCQAAVAPASGTPDDKSKESHKSGAVTKWVILGVVVTVLLVTILFKAKKKEENFRVLGKENLDDVVQVRVASINRRTGSSIRRTGSYNETGSQSSRRGGPAGGNLPTILS